MHDDSVDVIDGAIAIMGKLVTLRFNEGNFEQGFSVTVQIGQDGSTPSSEVRAILPPSPELPKLYDAWQSIYLNIGKYRLTPDPNPITIVSFVNDCCDAADKLTDQLNQWLKCQSFLSARESLFGNIQRTDEVRVLLQSGNSYIQRMPWHLWDLFDHRCTKAEIAIAAPEYRIEGTKIPIPNKNRILAILGNSEGIDVDTDRMILEKLPNAEVTLLVKPKQHELNDQLWQQHWDILFFAGHSSTQEGIGRIYINETESLQIKDLRYGMRTAVANGLRLAIFNSCDGLGLARSLSDLHIPQVIVMREPIPDEVAQKFLRYFLEDFSTGTSCYLSVRRARERLQGIEDRFPCATWLPIIWQNPAESPLEWTPPTILDPKDPQDPQDPQDPIEIILIDDDDESKLDGDTDIMYSTKRQRLFQLPQTYMLLTGAAIGLVCFVAVLRPRPVVLVSGSAIAAIIFVSWSWQVKKEFAWLNENNLLDREVYSSKLEKLERKSAMTAMQWRRAKAWAKEIHAFALQIVEKEPSLTLELLETLITVLALAEQVIDAISTVSQVKSENYRLEAQKRLQASYDRLQATHEQLQHLQDQVLLLSLDQSTSSRKMELPAQLKLVIDTNKITLQSNES